MKIKNVQVLILQEKIFAKINLTIVRATSVIGETCKQM